MRLVLRDGLTFGVVSERAVFLDLLADRYFCLPPAANADFLALLSSGYADDEGLGVPPTSLLGFDILKRTDEAVPIRAASTMTPRSTVLNARDRLGWSAASPPVLQAHIKAWWHLRRHGLARLADLHPGPPQEEQEMDMPMVQSLVGRFRTSDWLFGAADRCLLKSLALKLYLQQHGQGPRLVFGARLLPFEAHCWLQIGETVLNDYHEQVVQFTPVCVL